MNDSLAHVQAHTYASFDDIAPRFDLLFESVRNVTRLEGLSLNTILSQHGGAKILDCAAGTGIQTLGLVAHGYDVVASDISTRMLDVLRAKAKSEDVAIETRAADFRALSEFDEASFDGVVCCGNSLPLVPEGSQIPKAIVSMMRTVKREGLVVLGLHDYRVPESRGENVIFRNVLDGGSGFVVDHRAFRTADVLVTHVFVDHAVEPPVVEAYTKRYLRFTPEWIATVMTSSGLDDVRILDEKGEERHRGSEWYLAVGVRP